MALPTHQKNYYSKNCISNIFFSNYQNILKKINILKIKILFLNIYNKKVFGAIEKLNVLLFASQFLKSVLFEFFNIFKINIICVELAKVLWFDNWYKISMSLVLFREVLTRVGLVQGWYCLRSHPGWSGL
jgi:hypothetical protein